MSQLKSYALKQAEGVPLRLGDIEGLDVAIVGVSFSSGSFGPYLVMEVVKEDGEALSIMTGAKLVVDALEHAVTNDALPCMARFVQSGQTWLVEDADAEYS